MIYDNLSDWRRYVPRSHASEFCQAVEFLRTFTPDTPEGKHVLIEGKIYANVQIYTPKPLEEGSVEYHRDFVDIQTLLYGLEDLYYAPLAALQKKTPFDPEKDCGFYHFDAQYATGCRLEPGNFIMLFPGEGHMPSLACGNAPAPVKKVVVKIHRSIFED